jgi:hypothetical protein
MPGEEPKRGDEQPRPIPGPERRGRPAAEAPEIPPEIQKMIQPRGPFANYYFNELNRDRVWLACQARGDFSQVAGVWKLSGQWKDSGKVEVTLGAESSSGSFPTGAAKIEEGKDLDQQLDPPVNGSILAALHLWRQLLVGGPQRYGDVYYYGTAPYPAVAELADVLVGTRNVSETNFAFDPQTGLLAVVEATIDSAEDPLVLRLGDYRDLGGRQFPHLIEVRQGDRLLGIIEWSKAELATAEEARP